jgi:Ca2+-binding RTX toxin-like protein
MPGAGSVFDGGNDFDTLLVDISKANPLVDLRTSTFASLELLRLAADAATAAQVRFNASQFTGNFSGIEVIETAADADMTVVVYMGTSATLDLSTIYVSDFQRVNDLIRVLGSAPDQTIGGSNARDSLDGGAGNDSLSGHGGPDILRGGTGNDTLTGGAGNDTLFGSEGGDLMTGGTGSDWFRFTAITDSLLTPATSRDLITDFDRYTGPGDVIYDRLDLRAIATGVSGQDAFNLVAGPTTNAGSVWVSQSTSGSQRTLVNIETNGLAGVDGQIMLSGFFAFTAGTDLLL